MRATNETALFVCSSRSHFCIGDIATGQVEDVAPDDGKNPAAVALGKLGGSRGGKARAKNLSSSERREIASRAAAAG